jgi:hypothetical protein
MKDEKNEQDFPGYPHYDPKDDIMRSTENKRVDTDVENLSRANNLKSSDLPENRAPFSDTDNGSVEKDGQEEPNDADLTADDLAVLGQADGETARTRVFDGEELDIPGAEDDDANEAIGEEDEENNYYSLGGDAHENLEEDRGV